LAGRVLKMGQRKGKRGRGENAREEKKKKKKKRLPRKKLATMC